MADKVSEVECASKLRMNLAAITKVDPYAKDIIDSSAHVAFYTFNSTRNEWEKTDVEGAFFIYGRNAEPYYSIFINNRLNTTSFVEPLTLRLEIQSQPPFLLYRNERCRIRGFWFYSSQECDRISFFITSLLQKLGSNSFRKKLKNGNTNIFHMLSKAHKEYTEDTSRSNCASCNVLSFFAAAKPTSRVGNQGVIPKSLSVHQVEKQITPQQTPDISVVATFRPDYSDLINKYNQNYTPELPGSSMEDLLKTMNLRLISNGQKFGSTDLRVKVDNGQDRLFNNFSGKTSSKKYFGGSIQKPFMLTSLFEKSQFHRRCESFVSAFPLNYSQFLNAFTYLIEHDENFVKKLYDAYLQLFPFELR